MAYQVYTGGELGVVSAHNETHRATVALELAGGAKAHYDGPEWSRTGVEQVVGAWHAQAPSSLAAALDVLERCVLLHDDHVTRHNSGSGRKVYAHKAAGAAVGGTASPAGATLEADMIAAWGPVAITLATRLRAHLLNTGTAWHATADTYNAVPLVPTSITTKGELAALVSSLWYVYEAHRVASAGGAPHSAADNANGMAVPPPDNADDWDGVLACLQGLITKMTAHLGNAVIHANADAVALPASPTMPASVTTALARCNTIKSAHNTHCGDAALHEAADATNTVSTANATGVAGIIAIAAELWADQPAHMRYAPVSAALRSVG